MAVALTGVPALCNQLAAPFVQELPGYPLSKYMRRFLDRGLPVYFLHLRRDPTVALPPLVFPDLQRGFRTRRPGGSHE